MAEHRHWKEDRDSKYLSAVDLLADGKDIIVRIKDVIGDEKVFNPQSKTQEKKRVIYFEGDVKPMICNQINSSIIERVVGSGYYDEWVGKKIQLYAAEESRSQTGFAIRVRDFAPGE